MVSILHRGEQKRPVCVHASLLDWLKERYSESIVSFIKQLCFLELSEVGDFTD